LDESIALSEFSKRSRRTCVESFKYAHIEVVEYSISTQAGDMLATAAPNLKALEAWGEELLPGGGLQSCFFVDDLFFAAYNEFHGATVYNHPWKLWLFREAKRRKLSKEPAFEPCRRGGCSPVTIRLRYPDGLAMGHTRETHSENCARELAALGWWPPPSGAAKFRDDLCRMGDF
jgi:hypothetical protein